MTLVVFLPIERERERERLAVTTEEDLFAWGVGEPDQLSLGNKSNRLTLTRVEAEKTFDGSRALAACGNYHT